jgi:hypothetical protein
VEPDDGENGQRRLCRGGRREGAGRLCRAGPDIFMARFGTKMEANSGDQHSADRPISRLRGGRRRPSASVSRVTIGLLVTMRRSRGGQSDGRADGGV